MKVIVKVDIIEQLLESPIDKIFGSSDFFIPHH
jgi:hypothetical protein